MGSDEGQPDEQAVHRVRVDTFDMAVYPITRRDYAAFIEAADRAVPHEWDNPLFAEPEQPVVGVSWNDAVVYCLWHSSSSEGPDVRLPTEAEWERAARGGRAAHRYPWGTKSLGGYPTTARDPSPRPG